MQIISYLQCIRIFFAIEAHLHLTDFEVFMRTQYIMEAINLPCLEFKNNKESKETSY